MEFEPIRYDTEIHCRSNVAGCRRWSGPSEPRPAPSFDVYETVGGNAADGVTLEKRIETVRARIAFYASTPGYRAAFEVHGLGDLADRLSQYSRAQRWNEMEH
ncbi:MAG: hypothetical protein CM1200mP41_18670 [Gammaproteobacteria bacterium]|nr:MAG: hypothetical protein CM1200mP41_18670 [Gammaproteobacteria bacterium]